MQYPNTFLLEYYLVSTDCFNVKDKFEFTLFTRTMLILVEVFTHSENRNGLPDNYTRTSHEVELYMYICFNKSTREYPHFLIL